MKFLLLLYLIIISGFLHAQDLPMPRNFQDLYDGPTRSYTGAPGDEYWQNHASYIIQVNLDPDGGTVDGTAKITYTNESPDTLKYLVLKLLPDVYKKGSQRDQAINPADIHGGVNISQLEVSLSMKDSIRQGTNLITTLNQPLNPGEDVSIDISWDFPLPDYSTIRHGIYESDEIYVAYWYPQVAVYDDLSGWDLWSYTGMVETYNDFSDYEVSVTVPQGYVVWGTGQLQNPGEVLHKSILKKYEQALESSEIIHVISAEDLEKGNLTAKKETLTYRYTAQNVMDFAFATSNRYLWDASTLELTDGRRVLVAAAFDSASIDFYEVADIARKSIQYFSEEMPGVLYPYPEMTVFNGGGGMEFPMMVNDGSTSPGRSVIYLTSHEVAHTYFPFYMGTNERKYAFMDEGWAMKLPFGFQSLMAPDFDPVERTILAYERFAGSEFEIPMMTPTIAINGQVNRPVYRNSAYYKPGTAYHMLHQLLGDEIFMQALHTYMERWHRKHPLPYDFFFTFNEVAEEDLNWFWESWFFKTDYPDLAISDVKQQGENIEVSVERVGKLPVPIRLQLHFDDGSTELVEESMRIWKDGKTSHTFEFDTNKKLQKVEIGGTHVPDSNDQNNFWPETRNP